ncbi:hypothetical protein DEM28_27600, partial [Enterobacter mori]
MDEISSELEFKIDDMTFSDIQKEFPHVIEIVDIEQFTFRNVCESEQKFRALPKSEKCKYNMCDFPAE